jgi:hypothetical protein
MTQLGAQLDVAPTELTRSSCCRGYKDFAPTELPESRLPSVKMCMFPLFARFPVFL